MFLAVIGLQMSLTLPMVDCHYQTPGFAAELKHKICQKGSQLTDWMTKKEVQSFFITNPEMI